MSKIKFWALRTLFLIGQIPSALALLCFLIVWTKLGNISYTFAAVCCALLVLAVAFVQVTKVLGAGPGLTGVQEDSGPDIR